MYIYILHTSITSALSNVQRHNPQPESLAGLLCGRSGWVLGGGAMLSQWSHWLSGFISGCENLFFAKMDANSGYAKPWYPCQWGMKTRISMGYSDFFPKTVARQSFLTTHQIVNSRQADKQCQTHIEKHEMLAKYINLRWQPQSMGYKVDVALL